MDSLSKLGGHAHWFLRFALASVFLYHGVQKFLDLDAAAQGLRMPVLVAALIATVEVGSVLLLLAGVTRSWMTRVAGLGFVVLMLGAISTVHYQFGWHSIGALGMEFQVTLMMIGLYFLVAGNGVSAAETLDAAGAAR